MKKYVRILLPLSVLVLNVAFVNCTSRFQPSGSGSSSVLSSQSGGGSSPTSPGPSPSPAPSPSPSPSPVTGGNPSSAASYFPSSIYFNQSIANAAVDSQSATIISTLAANGGWGNNNVFQIDFSIDVYYTDQNTIRLPLQDDGMYSPDSDSPATIPLAPAPNYTGFEGQCRGCAQGDAHYLAMDLVNQQLTEFWEANDVTSTHFGSNGSLAIWPFNKNWLPNFRGDVCTSADAGGLMIAPMLFSAEEINAGQINHAIRLILPNSRIANRTYVRPATHTTGGSGWAPSTTGVPYGARFRLKPSFNVAGLPSAGAKTVARALQTYGMILADGGNIALTAKTDITSTAKYGSMLGSGDLNTLQVSDFEIVDGETRYTPSAYDCVRNP